MLSRLNNIAAKAARLLDDRRRSLSLLLNLNLEQTLLRELHRLGLHRGAGERTRHSRGSSTPHKDLAVEIDMLDKARRYMWYLGLMALIPLVVATVSCDSADGTERVGVVLSESGTPVVNATVYAHRKRGNRFDGSWHYQTAPSNGDGRYRFGPAAGQFIQIIASAEGYYPGLSDASGTVRLRKVPADPLPVQEAVLRGSPGDSCGFNLATGRQCAPAEADFTIALGRSETFRITASGSGGVVPLQLVKGDESAHATTLRFTEATDAPHDGYVRSMRSNPFNYEAWWVRTRDGRRYDKLLFDGVGEGADGGLSISFRYVYQPNGEREVAGIFTDDDLRSLLGI
jgi:hypothetical protein